MYILKLCKSSTQSSKVILLVLPTLCIHKIQAEDNPFVKQKESPSQIVKHNYHQNYLLGAAQDLPLTVIMFGRRGIVKYPPNELHDRCYT